MFDVCVCMFVVVVVLFVCLFVFNKFVSGVIFQFREFLWFDDLCAE